VRQQVAERGIRLGAVGLEAGHAVVQREAAFLGAAQDQRRREDLGEPVQVERGVAAGRDASLDVLHAEGTFPQNVVLAGDGGHEARDAGLAAQRVEVLAEQPDEKFFGGDRHPDEQDQTDRGDQQ